MPLVKRQWTVLARLSVNCTRSFVAQRTDASASASYHSFVKVVSPPAPLPADLVPHTTQGVITYTQPISPPKNTSYDGFSSDPSDHIIDLSPGSDYSSKPDVREYLRLMGQRRGYVGKQWYDENVERGRAYLEGEMKAGRGLFVTHLPESFWSSHEVTQRRRQAWIHLARLEEIEDAALRKSDRYWERQRQDLAAGKGWASVSCLGYISLIAFSEDELYPARTGLLKTNIRAPVPSDLSQIGTTDDNYPSLIQRLYSWGVHPVSIAYINPRYPAGYVYMSRNESLELQNPRFKTLDEPEPYIPMEPDNEWGADVDGETVHPDAVIGDWQERAEIRLAKKDGRWDAWETERLAGDRMGWMPIIAADQGMRATA
ncbi:hypothetical protein IAU59_000203 [Kwoniella sp. CBS 9459]